MSISFDFFGECGKSPIATDAYGIITMENIINEDRSRRIENLINLLSTFPNWHDSDVRARCLASVGLEDKFSKTEEDYILRTITNRKGWYRLVGLFLALIFFILPFFVKEFTFIETPQNEIAFIVGNFLIGIIIIIALSLF